MAFCVNCGSELVPGAKFCIKCGTPVPTVEEPVSETVENKTVDTPVVPTAVPPVVSGEYNSTGSTQHTYTSTKAEKPQVDFGTAIKMFFERYTDFEGRSTRAEFWYAVLFNVIVSLAIGIIGGVNDTFGNVLSGIWSLATLVPGLAISVRRLHDIGKQWTWILMGLIPLVGWIFMIIYYTTESDGPNKWGE